jgi:penicillin-binding protein 1A
MSDPDVTARAHAEQRSPLRRLFPREGPWWRRWQVPLIGAAIIAMLIGLVAFMFAGFYATASIPDTQDLGVPEPTTVRALGGEEVNTLDPSAVRGNVTLEELPEHVVHAVFTAEDREYPNHIGISFRAMARAAVRNVRAMGIAEGGSTITQQYVNITMVEARRTFTGKLREMAYAIRLEQQTEKEEVLELYLNSVPLGRTAVGIEAASQIFFGKPAVELDVNEAATLAGMIAAPTAFDPAEHPDAADTRRTWVLENMAEMGWLDEQEAQALIAEGLPEVDPERPFTLGAEAYYLDALRREVESLIGDDYDMYSGLEIISEMDLNMQTAAVETLSDHLAGVEYSGAIVTIDPQSGAVRALVGGPDFAEQSFNAAIQALRQPGSAFKTFGLAAWFDAGYSPESTFDAAEELEVDFPGHGPYEVTNYQDTGFGTQSVREATLTSTNTVFVQMAAEITPEAVQNIAMTMGIRDHDDFDPLPSLIIGTEEVTPLNMTEAYATLAGGGVHRTPRFVREIRDSVSGEVIYQAEGDGEQVIDENLAYQVSELLESVVQAGTGTAAQIGRPVAGKTGTTDDYRDAWFAGYIPQLATSVWVGNLDFSPMPNVSGGSLPAQIWAAYMARAVEGMDVEAFPAADWSGLQTLDRAPEPEPSPIETPEPSPSPEDDEDDLPEPTPPPTDEEDEEDDEEDDEIEPTPPPGDGDGDTNDEGG